MDCRTLTRRLPLVLACAVLLALGAGVATAQAGPTTRELERLNWMEFRELVPAKVRTVIVPFGTVEEHGASPNGTDIPAPLAIARLVVDVIGRWDAMGL